MMGLMGLMGLLGRARRFARLLWLPCLGGARIKIGKTHRRSDYKRIQTRGDLCHARDVSKRWASYFSSQASLACTLLNSAA